MIHDSSGRQHADSSADAIGHEHEESLSGGLHLGRGLLLHIESAADIEEIESHAIYDHRQNEEDYARHSRFADSEESEPQHPAKHSDKHHILNAEFAQTEGNEQYAASLGNLAERSQQCGIVGRKRIEILRQSLE